MSSPLDLPYAIPLGQQYWVHAETDAEAELIAHCVANKLQHYWQNFRYRLRAEEWVNQSFNTLTFEFVAHDEYNLAKVLCSSDESTNGSKPLVDWISYWVQSQPVSWYAEELAAHRAEHAPAPEPVDDSPSETPVFDFTVPVMLKPATEVTPAPPPPKKRQTGPKMNVGTFTPTLSLSELCST